MPFDYSAARNKIQSAKLVNIVKLNFSQRTRDFYIIRDFPNINKAEEKER